MSTDPLLSSDFVETLLATQNGPQAAATLRFGPTHTGLAFGGSVPAIRIYAFGPEYLARHWPPAAPSAAQLEYAIAAVEDELQRVHRLCGTPPALASVVCHDPEVRTLATHLGLPAQGSGSLRREAVEHGFARLAAQAEGGPPDPGAMPQDCHALALLLILRELMQHLPLAALELPA